MKSSYYEKPKSVKLQTLLRFSFQGFYKQMHYKRGRFTMIGNNTFNTKYEDDLALVRTRSWQNRDPGADIKIKNIHTSPPSCWESCPQSRSGQHPGTTC